MKRCIAILVIVALSVGLSSCKPTQDLSNGEDTYLAGLDRGYEDVFMNLWWAATPGVNLLGPGDVWETDHFSLLIQPVKKEDANYIRFELTTYNHTMSECFEDQKMLFNAFAYDGSQYDALLTDDLFYMYATLEVYEEHTSHATVRLYENTERVAIVIVVDGCAYKATYRNL